MTDNIQIDGTIKNIIFSNNDSGYYVFSVQTDKYIDEFKSDDIVCTGYIEKMAEGENIRITGSIINHHVYGKQLEISSYEKTMPKTKTAMEIYLGSGIIKGIGKKLAKKIIDEFGTDAFLVIENTPEKLSKIRGITEIKAMEIGEIFLENIESKDTMVFLQGYGISPNMASKIYSHYKKNTMNIFKANPYKLADDIFSIGFNMMDKVAEQLGIEKDSPYRIKSGIKYILNKNAVSFGHIYLPEDKLLKESVALLNINEEDIIASLSTLQIEREIHIEKIEDNKNIIFLNINYYTESFIAKKIVELSRFTTKYKKKYDEWLNDIEKEEGMQFAKEQKDAIKNAMTNGVLVITGGPGTGKTTILNAIINMLQRENYEIELCAPTGRASKRMSEATGLNAQTIHRLLGISFLSSNNQGSRFEKDEDMPIEADVIIVDECSMVDTFLMSSFLKAVAYGSRLIIVGDANQLPSVGAGNILKDIIKSEKIPVVSLKEIFRQAKQSAIVVNAHKINSGIYPSLNEKNNDFFFIKEANADNVGSTITQLVTKRLPKFLNIDDPKYIQVLSPIKKSPIGVIALNNLLQNEINPPNDAKNEMEFRDTTFREGDKVMQIKNNYNISWKIVENGKTISIGVGVFNGDEGIIDKIDKKKGIMTIVFDSNKYIDYDFTQLDELDLSYAITIHKSQGSEYKAVVIPIHSGPPMFLTRNLLYTAVTRATNIVVIVGVPQVLNKMVDNNSEVERYTYLKDRIQYFYSIV